METAQNLQADKLPEIVFGTSDPSEAKQISRLERMGKLQKIAPRLYTSNLIETPEAIVRRNLFRILGHLFPGALLSHRSAFEFKPGPEGDLFLTYKYTRKVTLPGLTVRLMEGPTPLEGDHSIAPGLFASQQARAILENLQPTRKTDSSTKILDTQKIEEKIEEVIRVHGEGGANKMREQARKLAEQLGWDLEMRRFEKLLGAMLSSRPSDFLSSPLAIARAFGKPYDAPRLEIFQELFVALATTEFPYRPDLNITEDAYDHFAFFESYFSNYIEGTRFEVSQALEIIETQTAMATRHDDSHDILGTFNLVSNQQEMSRVPKDATELIALLKERHALLLSARTDKNPGQFKHLNNMAGMTQFVDFRLVEGTLIKGFDLYKGLHHPFAKAVYMMFLISEVHPFVDGNGRVARVFLNAELSAADQSKIIIPTVYQEDYVLALRKLTREKDPAPFIRMMERAYAFSATLKGQDFEALWQQLKWAHAFHEPTEGKLQFP